MIEKRKIAVGEAQVKNQVAAGHVLTRSAKANANVIAPNPKEMFIFDINLSFYASFTATLSP